MYTPEQQATHRELWVAALRSGKYPQGRGKLRDEDKFCCLGVACELAISNKVAVEKDHLGYGGQTIVLPKIVQDWLGLADEMAALCVDGDYATLAGYNDNGFSFEEIANLIENNLIALEVKE